MKWKQIIKDYFSFSRKDRIGIIIILALLVLLLFAPTLYERQQNLKVSEVDSTWATGMQALLNQDSSQTDHISYDPTSGPEPSSDLYYQNISSMLFYFDPNTLPQEGWKKLGIRDKTISTIMNYRNKDGRFRNPEDLSKIYGLSKKDFERLSPYIKINATSNTTTSTTSLQPYEEKNTYTINHYEKRYQLIDINTGDTTAFIQLPGIGSKLASRIIKFRESLGGFYQIEQVKEVYGIPDSTFTKIKPYLKIENKTVQKININTATLDDFKKHPYLGLKLARPIIAYRNEHGPFNKTEELKNIMAISDEIFQKLQHYLTLE